MKKLLMLILSVVIAFSCLTCFVACGKTEKPTAAFTSFSNYIEKNGKTATSSSKTKQLTYTNLSDSYFGTINTIKVEARGGNIYFWFYASGKCSLSVRIYNFSPAEINVYYKEVLGDIVVDIDYSSLSSVSSGKVNYVEAADVKQSTTSNIYTGAVSNAQKALSAAISWMSAIVKNAIGTSYTVHSLYN